MSEFTRHPRQPRAEREGFDALAADHRRVHEAQEGTCVWLH